MQLPTPTFIGIRAAEIFGLEEPEPGPYYIYEVLRKLI